MPTMPRTHGKAEKVAYKIIGKPANLFPRLKSKKDRRVNDRLVFEETILVK